MTPTQHDTTTRREPSCPTPQPTTATVPDSPTTADLPTTPDGSPPQGRKTRAIGPPHGPDRHRESQRPDANRPTAGTRAEAHEEHRATARRDRLAGHRRARSTQRPARRRARRRGRPRLGRLTGPPGRHPGRARDGRAAAPRHSDRAAHDLARGRIGHLRRGRDRPRRPPLDRRPHRATRSRPPHLATTPTRHDNGATPDPTTPDSMPPSRSADDAGAAPAASGHRHTRRAALRCRLRRLGDAGRIRTEAISPTSVPTRNPSGSQRLPGGALRGMVEDHLRDHPEQSGARSRSARSCTAPRARWPTHWKSWSPRTSRNEPASGPSATASPTSPSRAPTTTDQTDARHHRRPPSPPPRSGRTRDDTVPVMTTRPARSGVSRPGPETR